MNGGLPQNSDHTVDASSGRYGYGVSNSTSYSPRPQISKNGSVDALTLAQHLPEEPIPDIYSQSDAKVIQGWRHNRPNVSPSAAQPKYKWSIGSPASQRQRGGGYSTTYGRRPKNRLERAETLAGDIMGQQPECPVCYEAYCDSEPVRIPRSLHCGHSCCTGEE